MTDTNEVLPEIPMGVTIDREGGVSPMDIEGCVDGTPFYFRARGFFWTLSIGKAPLCSSEWFWGQRYSHEKYKAGFMSLGEARSFLFESIGRYRAGEPGNSEEHFAERAIEEALGFESSFEELEKEDKFKEFVAKHREVLAKARAEGKIPNAA